MRKHHLLTTTAPVPPTGGVVVMAGSGGTFIPATNDYSHSEKPYPSHHSSNPYSGLTPAAQEAVKQYLHGMSHLHMMGGHHAPTFDTSKLSDHDYNEVLRNKTLSGLPPFNTPAFKARQTVINW